MKGFEPYDTDKITGMLLEGEPVGALSNFLTDSAALEVKVQEAIRVLEEHTAAQAQLQLTSSTLGSSTHLPSDDEGDATDEGDVSDEDAPGPTSTPRGSRWASVSSDSS